VNDWIGSVLAEWVPLLGRYETPDGRHVYVRENRGQMQVLVALVEAARVEMLPFNGRFYAVLPLRPLGQDRFELPDGTPLGSSTVEFTRGAGGVGLAARAGSRDYARRLYGPETGEMFAIHAMRPVDELRTLAGQACPPVESGERLRPDMVDVHKLDGSIQLDIRYATTNNFMRASFYSQPRAVLQRPAADALARVHCELRSFGYGLTVHDAYRPWYVTWMFWEATPPEMRNFVADPALGSRHNRGAAVDVSLYDLRTGEAADFGADYDEFSERSFIDYPGGSSLQRWRRELLAFHMTRAGFDRFHDEWWHFDLRGWHRYPILNASFDQLRENLQ
jgi:D-alanyl-D-alanine dipeptidase